VLAARDRWIVVTASSSSAAPSPRSRRRSRKRQLFCPAHADHLLAGGGKRYFLHLLSAEELTQRGMKAAKAKLLISAYPVFTLSDEWLEELFCPSAAWLDGAMWCAITGCTTRCAGRLVSCGSRWPMLILYRPTQA